MSADVTEDLRRQRCDEINSDPGGKEELAAKHGQLWDTDQLTEDFAVLQFAAPYVIVSRKSDNVRGSLEFQHSPRFYFNFQPE